MRRPRGHVGRRHRGPPPPRAHERSAPLTETYEVRFGRWNVLAPLRASEVPSYHHGCDSRETLSESSDFCASARGARVCRSAKPLQIRGAKIRIVISASIDAASHAIV